MLAPVFNVGTLLAPTTKDDFLHNRVPQPQSLLSHQDQQHQWQTAISDQASRTGWGGRLADTLPAGTLPPLISIAGNQLFAAGMSTQPLALPAAGGSFGLSGFDASPAGQARKTAFDHVRMAADANLLEQATAAEVAASIQASQIVAPVLAGTGSGVDTHFTGLTSGIAKQLNQVARLVEARATLGASRQIFFVSQGGYDTHNDQLDRQDALFADLSPALKAFYDATVGLGVGAQVTTFTLSDFARTLKPASGGGSDHAWGNHQIVIGGAVKGGTTYGTLPALVLGGPDDFTAEGRWVPTLAVDQYAATLATWFGVSPSDLPKVLPYVGRYSTSESRVPRPIVDQTGSTRSSRAPSCAALFFSRRAAATSSSCARNLGVALDDAVEVGAGRSSTQVRVRVRTVAIAGASSRSDISPKTSPGASVPRSIESPSPPPCPLRWLEASDCKTSSRPTRTTKRPSVVPPRRSTVCSVPSSRRRKRATRSRRSSRVKGRKSGEVWSSVPTRRARKKCMRSFETRGSRLTSSRTPCAKISRKSWS